MMRRPDTVDDRHCVAKHDLIFPSDEELEAQVTVAAATTSRPRRKGKAGGQKPSSTTDQPSTGSSPQSESKCIACGEADHPLHHCRTFKKMVFNKKSELIRLHRRCRLCFKPNHWSTQCQSGLRCQICQGDHNTLMHRDAREVGPLASPPPPTASL